MRRSRDPDGHEVAVQAKQRRSTAMIGTNGATDEFIVVARFETMISSSRCLYMANAIQLG